MTQTIRGKREAVRENGKVVGWYCWSYNAMSQLTKMFVPAG